MFALFDCVLSSREKLIQSLRLNPGLELFMKPDKQMPPMATLDFPPSLSDGDRALPLRLQTGALFLQEDIGQHGQGPEAHDGGGTHQLILVQAQLLFAIAQEVFYGPA